MSDAVRELLDAQPAMPNVKAANGIKAVAMASALLAMCFSINERVLVMPTIKLSRDPDAAKLRRTRRIERLVRGATL